MTNKQAGAIVRKDFGGMQITAQAETAALAVAAQAKAAIEARWLVATHQPRNIETVRLDLLKECQRPSFAAAARYKKPIGQGIEGLSIRFVEAALQVMGNADVEAITIYDDAEKRIVEVRVTDFQRNICHRKQITITKTVERKFLRKGQQPISSRTNSQGEVTYLIAASEDDLLNKEGALVSKAIRTCGLRIIPGWLQDECTEMIKLTAKNEAARDPDAEKRKLLDGFGSIGVTPDDLEAYLGHPLAQVVDVELVDLRAVWTTIQNGEATWVDTLAHRQSLRGEDRPQEAPQEAAKAKPAQNGTQGVKDALAKRGKPQAKAPAPSGKPEPKTDAEREQIAKDVTEAKAALAAHDVEVPQARVEDVAPETLDAAVAPPVKVKAKRPSRSRDAQEERKVELRSLGLTPNRFTNLYIQGGDPRNKAKAIAAAKVTAEVHADDAKMEAEAKAAASNAQAEGNIITTEGTRHDADTGEVEEEPPQDEEPDWMRGTPPAGEGF